MHMRNHSWRKVVVGKDGGASGVVNFAGTQDASSTPSIACTWCASIPVTAFHDHEEGEDDEVGSERVRLR